MEEPPSDEPVVLVAADGSTLSEEEPSILEDLGIHRLPGWVLPSIVLFWVAYLIMLIVQNLWERLAGLTLILVISLFLALAIEPGVNRLARRGWRRGRATAAILLGVLLVLMRLRRRDRHAGRHADRRPAVELRDVHHRHGRLHQRHVRHGDRRPRRDRRVQRSERRGPEVHRQPAGQRGAALRRRARNPAPGFLGAPLHVLPRRRRPSVAALDLQPSPSGATSASARRVGTGDHQDRRLPVLTCVAGDAVGVVPLDRVPGGRNPGADPTRALGRPRQPVPPRRRHLHRRRSAGAASRSSTRRSRPRSCSDSSSSTSRSRTTSSHRRSPPARWSCTRRSRSARRSAAPRCSDRQAPFSPYPAAAMVQALATEWGHRHDVVDSDLTRIERASAPRAPATPRTDMSASSGVRTRRSRSPSAAATTSASTSARPWRSTPTAPSRSRSATRRSTATRGRPRNRCRPKRCSAPGSTCHSNCSRSSCASHDGTPSHVAGVRRILAGAGLDESALGNTPDLPIEPMAAADVLRAGGERKAIQMNCSGKHAGDARHVRGATGGQRPTTSIEDHPLQRAINGDRRGARR